MDATIETHHPKLSSTSGDDWERARALVSRLARIPIGYMDWIRIGLALYAGFGNRGKELWLMFLDNPHYQDSQRDLNAKWASFRNVREIDLGTLFAIGSAYGCE